MISLVHFDLPNVYFAQDSDVHQRPQFLPPLRTRIRARHSTSSTCISKHYARSLLKSKCLRVLSQVGMKACPRRCQLWQRVVLGLRFLTRNTLPLTELTLVPITHLLSLSMSREQCCFQFANLCFVSGKPFLQLNNPKTEPSPAQQHAIRVLSYTFPLLSIRPRTYNRPVIRQRTDVVHQPQPAVQIRALPIRALLAPLILLGLRTLLLLYFFSPARKPLFSILLAGWVIYEAWGAVRGALVDLNDLPANGNAQQAGGVPDAGAQRAAAGNNVNDAAGDRRADQARPRNSQNMQRNTGDNILSRLAKINLMFEEYALAGATINAEEPSFLSKARSFVTLFLLSLHPDIWKRRCKALREREGRIRAETIKRRTPTDENQTVGGGSEEVTRARQRLIETHERRRPWVKEYIGRVEQDEWIDD